MAAQRREPVATTVNSIFAAAKAQFHYLSDQQCFGRPEYWACLTELERAEARTGEIQGDCDDFAAWCVGHLRAAGLPGRYVLCQVETGEWHCVAESNGLILDNRQSMVMHFFGLPYVWHSVSGYHAGEPWHSIKKV